MVIVGGVAGGATCAARLRRLDENAEVVVLDRGPYVSFANCGLPYYVGDVIHGDAKLLLATPKLFRERFNIEVRTRNEVVVIDRKAGESLSGILRRLATIVSTMTRSYCRQAPHPSAAFAGHRPQGNLHPAHVPDSRVIREWIDEREPRRAVVVGGGFIGLEMAENLVHRGLESRSSKWRTS